MSVTHPGEQASPDAQPTAQDQERARNADLANKAIGVATAIIDRTLHGQSATDATIAEVLAALQRERQETAQRCAEICEQPDKLRGQCHECNNGAGYEFSAWIRQEFGVEIRCAEGLE